MLTIGPKQNANTAPQFFGSMFALQAVVGLIGAILTLLGTYIIDSVFPALGLRKIAIPLAVAIVCSQTQDFLRRYFFAVRRSEISFWLDAVRCLGQNCAILTLGVWLPADTVTVLWLFAVAAATAALMTLPRIPRLHYSLDGTIRTGLQAWQFSKWLGGSTLVGFAFANLFNFAGGILLSVTAVGAMRAAFALVSITNLVIEAFANIVPVEASRELINKGRSGLVAYLKKITIYGFLAIVILLGIIVAGSKFWLNLFFGSEFASYSNLVFWYAGIQIVTFFAFVIGTFYRTLESTKFIFSAYTFSAVLSLTIAYPLITSFGITGAVLGLLISQIAQLLFMLVVGTARMAL
jgi:O-antigen/teichoic acid export membrane protein